MTRQIMSGTNLLKARNNCKVIKSSFLMRLSSLSFKLRFLRFFRGFLEGDTPIKIRDILP